MASRVLAAAAAVALLVVAAFNLLVIGFLAALSLTAPDPAVPDGDPCCSHPDDWGDVAAGLAGTLVFVVAEGLILAAIAGLAAWAAVGRWPAWRRLALVPAGTVLLAAVLIAVPLMPLLDEGR